MPALKDFVIKSLTSIRKSNGGGGVRGPVALCGRTHPCSVQQFVSILPAEDMVVTFRVFKKTAPNGRFSVYLGQRDFADNGTISDPIDGVLTVENDYLRGRKLYAQLICTFRYGREEDETMDLSFKKELFLASEEIYPNVNTDSDNRTKFQTRLIKKLDGTAVPFTFRLPATAPSSITLQPSPEDTGAPCGVEYALRVFVAASEEDEPAKRSTVSINVRKVQFAPSVSGRQPSAIVNKYFLLSPGELELEATLDKQLYHHQETIAVNVSIRNHSGCCVKRIRATLFQQVEVCIFSNGSYHNAIDTVDTQEGCPVNPGRCTQRVLILRPSLRENNNERGVALLGRLRTQDLRLASSTILADPSDRDVFGVIVSYSVQVKLILGALSGELVADLPFLLMDPKPSHARMTRRICGAEQVEDYRSESVDELDELDELDTAIQPADNTCDDISCDPAIHTDKCASDDSANAGGTELRRRLSECDGAGLRHRH